MSCFSSFSLFWVDRSSSSLFLFCLSANSASLRHFWTSILSWDSTSSFYFLLYSISCCNLMLSFLSWSSLYLSSSWRLLSRVSCSRSLDLRSSRSWLICLFKVSIIWSFDFTMFSNYTFSVSAWWTSLDFFSILRCIFWFSSALA